jgi:biopolymer transport protein ExbD
MQVPVLVAVGWFGAGPCASPEGPVPAAPPLALLQSLWAVAPNVPVVLMVNSKGELVVPGKEPLTDRDEIEKYLKGVLAKRKVGDVPPRVMIRADKDAEFEKVYAVMKSCRQVGFRSIMLRYLDKQTQ